MFSKKAEAIGEFREHCLIDAGGILSLNWAFYLTIVSYWHLRSVCQNLRASISRSRR